MALGGGVVQKGAGEAPVPIHPVNDAADANAIGFGGCYSVGEQLGAGQQGAKYGFRDEGSPPGRWRHRSRQVQPGARPALSSGFKFM